MSTANSNSNSNSGQVYYVTGWQGQTLTRQFGIFSNKHSILPLFEKFFSILPLQIFNRDRPNVSLNDMFHIQIQEIEIDKMFWYNEYNFGEVVFDSSFKTELQIRNFCSS